MPSEDKSLPERPVPPAPPAPIAPLSPADASETEAARMDVLRELERGDISVAEATEKLGRLDGVLR